MDKLYVRVVKAMLLPAFFVIFGSSCVNEEYDMNNVNLEVTPFVEGLTFPLGSTGQITLQDLLKDVNVLKADADDAYFLEYAGTLDMENEIPTFDELIKVPEIGGSHNLVLNIPSVDVSVLPGNVTLPAVEAELNDVFEFDILSPGDMPAEVEKLDVIEFEHAYVNLDLDASSLMPALGSASVELDFEVTLPEMIRLVGYDSNVLKLSGKVGADGRVSAGPFEVEALEVYKTKAEFANGLKESLSIEGSVRLENLSSDAYASLDDVLRLGFNVRLENADEEKSNLDVTRIECKVNYKFDPVVQTVDVSDFLGGEGVDLNLDFRHVDLSLALRTNLGVPVVANLDIVPFYDGSADESKTITDEIRFNSSESADKYAVTNYTFDENEIKGLINNVPEKLELRISAFTDSDADCVIEPAAHYELDAEYNLEIPLVFGDNLNVSYKEVITDIPEIMETLLSNGNKVVLSGEIENALPIGLEIELTLLDSDGRPVSAAGGIGQRISPCGPGGTASTTPLNIELALAEGAVAEDVASIELEVKADSQGAADIPVKATSYVQATLKLALPEGITLDLEELMNGDEQ